MNALAPDAQSRFAGRARTVARALALRRRDPVAPRDPRRILIAHHLLLGDTIMLTPLLKKARARFPEAEIVMAVPRAFAPLYSGRPYGVKPLPFDRRSLGDHVAMRSEAGFDLALVPGDNRSAYRSSRDHQAIGTSSAGQLSTRIRPRLVIGRYGSSWSGMAASSRYGIASSRKLPTSRMSRLLA